MYQTRKEIYEYDWAKQQLRKAVFDFDMIIGKVMAYDMLSRLPLSLYACSILWNSTRDICRLTVDTVLAACTRSSPFTSKPLWTQRRARLTSRSLSRTSTRGYWLFEQFQNNGVPPSGHCNYSNGF